MSEIAELTKEIAALKDELKRLREQQATPLYIVSEPYYYTIPQPYYYAVQTQTTAGDVVYLSNSPNTHTVG